MNALQQLVAALRAAGELTIAGIDFDLHDVDKLTVPNTAATRKAEEVCRDCSETALVNHSFRSYAWGALLGIAEGREFNAELLYVAALLHDIGLTSQFDKGGCFESDGADAAHELLLEVGWDVERAARVANAIYLHMHEVDTDDGTEALLLTYGTSMDVTGRRLDEIDPRVRGPVIDVYPREGFKQRFHAMFVDQAARKPACSVHAYMAAGLGERILNAPFSD